MFPPSSPGRLLPKLLPPCGSPPGLLPAQPSPGPTGAQPLPAPVRGRWAGKGFDGYLQGSFHEQDGVKLSAKHHSGNRRCYCQPISSCVVVKTGRAKQAAGMHSGYARVRSYSQHGWLPPLCAAQPSAAQPQACCCPRPAAQCDFQALGPVGTMGAGGHNGQKR